MFLVVEGEVGLRLSISFLVKGEGRLISLLFFELKLVILLGFLFEGLTALTQVIPFGTGCNPPSFEFVIGKLFWLSGGGMADGVIVEVIVPIRSSRGHSATSNNHWFTLLV